MIKETAKMEITPEAEKIIIKDVFKYIEELTEESSKMAYYAGRKTLRKEDVELAMKNMKYY